MISRRNFAVGAATVVAAPYVLKVRAAAQGPRIRRDVQSLAPNDPWFTKYGQAVQAMHDLQTSNASDQRSWRNQALIHINHCPHGAISFVHWHRHYIHNYELICGQLIGDPNFALAYWNWSEKRGTIPDPFYDLNQLNVQFWNDPSNAQSNNWGPDEVVTVGTRALAKGEGLQDDPDAGQEFTRDFIETRIQEQTSFTIFTRNLEGFPHNDGHVITGGANGHMVDGMSPLDPIFWLHHCNIDRIWAEWQTAGNTTPPLNLNYNNQFVNGMGQPVTASSASALNFAAMNYTYDTLSAPVVAMQLQQFGLAPNAMPPPPPLVETAPLVLGADTNSKTVAPNVETRFTLAAPDVLPSLFRLRTFRATKVPSLQRNAVGGGRILAKLSDVRAPQKRAPLLCKVFVNHPDLKPTTPTTDPHYAGTFSFFGMHGGTHDHSDIYVDITKPLRMQAGDGRINAGQVQVQLMPVALKGTQTNATFSVGKVELLSA
jgi:tyrosinase